MICIIQVSVQRLYKRNCSVLVTHHLVAAPDEGSHSPSVCALLDHQHLLPGRAERHLPHDASSTKLVTLQVLEPGHYSAVGGNSNELNLGSAHPSYSGQVVLEQQVVGLVIETPLANGKVGTGILDLLDHLDELVVFVAL